MFGGGLWPVVQRELRETARRPLNAWLRLGGALGGVIVFCSVAAHSSFAVVGAQLFSRIHLLLLGLICGLVPALTADCIARERREGTLGLLFMTPLTASGIVLGKILAQTLRAVTLGLAVLPVLTIPFLYGGITWADVAGYLIIELCAAMLCLAAGVLASCLTDSRAIAFILAFLLMWAFVGGARQFQNQRMMSSARSLGNGSFRFSYVFAPGSGMWFRPPRPRIVGAGPYVPGATPVGLAARRWTPDMLTEDFVVAAIILLAALRFAGWCVERSWQDKIPSVRRQGWVRRYCTPLFVGWFARRMRLTLERNPIAWLQQYSWKARLSKWGLCLLFLVLECRVIDGRQPDAIGGLVTALLVVLAAAYTFAGVNGFLQEKKSGALELILISPLSVKQIIFGRVWGLWKQFLPSLMLLVGSGLAVQVMLPHRRFYFGYDLDIGWNLFWVKDLEIMAIYLTLPVIATCFALSAKNLLVASALTLVAGFAPAILVMIITMNTDMNVAPLRQSLPGWLAFLSFCALAGQGFLAFIAYKFSSLSLGRRSYAF
jgi:ABC-type Na+ efflux pump permease subunit